MEGFNHHGFKNATSFLMNMGITACKEDGGIFPVSESIVGEYRMRKHGGNLRPTIVKQAYEHMHKTYETVRKSVLNGDIPDEDVRGVITNDMLDTYFDYVLPLYAEDKPAESLADIKSFWENYKK